MKTIAQQLNLKKFPLEIKDSSNNRIYYEDSDGYWVKSEFDSNNNEIYYENSDGHWVKREFDSNNNRIYFEDLDGHWVKCEFDSNNNRIYFETPNGIIKDNRVIPEYTIQELQKMLGKEFKIVK